MCIYIYNTSRSVKLNKNNLGSIQVMKLVTRFVKVYWAIQTECWAAAHLVIQHPLKLEGEPNLGLMMNTQKRVTENVINLRRSRYREKIDNTRLRSILDKMIIHFVFCPHMQEHDSLQYL